VRQASAVLAGAALLISPEGGLHHAAAALGLRAVVIFGGFISPATTGYDLHRNFFTGGQACGMRLACAHCAEAMARITPEEVAAAAREQLEDARETAVELDHRRQARL
jgi:ADP-heptose:LPS heptosyltransferase